MIYYNIYSNIFNLILIFIYSHELKNVCDLEIAVQNFTLYIVHQVIELVTFKSS